MTKAVVSVYRQRAEELWWAWADLRTQLQGLAQYTDPLVRELLYHVGYVVWFLSSLLSTRLSNQHLPPTTKTVFLHLHASLPLRVSSQIERHTLSSSPTAYHRPAGLILTGDPYSHHVPRAMASSHPPNTEGHAAGVRAGSSIVAGGCGLGFAGKEGRRAEMRMVLIGSRARWVR